MSSTILFIIGSVVFASTTFASVCAGCLIFQRAWVNQNPNLTSEGDKIRPLFAKSYAKPAPAVAPVATPEPAPAATQI